MVILMTSGTINNAKYIDKICFSYILPFSYLKTSQYSMST